MRNSLFLISDEQDFWVVGKSRLISIVLNSIGKLLLKTNDLSFCYFSLTNERACFTVEVKTGYVKSEANKTKDILNCF